MATWRVRRFTEPSEFAAALAGVKTDLSILGGGHFAAEIAAVELGSVRMHRLAERLPRIMHFDHLGGRATFSFLTQPGPSLIRNGVELTSETIVRVADRQSLFQRSAGPTNWGTISLPVKDLPCLSELVPGCELTPPPGEQIVTPRPGALANLQCVHAAVGSLAKQAPKLLDNLEVARCMEQILLQVLVACLDSGDMCEQTTAQRHHQTIMQRFHAFLEANPTRPVYVLEIAKAVGASVRTLSICCQEHLGMGPKKYLVLRRMHLARRALIRANPHVGMVAEVATQYGFWQFGRFAGEYKFLFGELPSATLQRRRA
jgi:AraC-like DNA-binding protein